MSERSRLPWLETARLAAGLLFCGTLLACGSGGESEGSAGVAAPVFSVDSVAVGIGFDEPVLIDGENGGGPLVSSTEIDLERADDDSPFVRSVSVSDGSGNTASVLVEVEIRKEASGSVGAP